MQQKPLEHLLRAVAAIASPTPRTALVVFGHQSLLGVMDPVPDVVAVATGAEIDRVALPRLGRLIDDTLGEGSVFHRHWGYYARGVPLEAMTLPDGWESRLIRLEGWRIDGPGYCVEPHDLAATWLQAGQAEDRALVRSLLDQRILDPMVLTARIGTLPAVDGINREWLSGLKSIGSPSKWTKEDR